MSQKKKTVGTEPHTQRSRLIWNEEKKKVVVRVICETCGYSGEVAVALPLPLNELHRFVLEAKEKLAQSCFAPNPKQITRRKKHT